MRQLTLTNDQFDALFDIVKDTVDYIEGDLITTEDDNGNEILEDISKYEAHQIMQQMIMAVRLCISQLKIFLEVLQIKKT